MKRMFTESSECLSVECHTDGWQVCNRRSPRREPADTASRRGIAARELGEETTSGQPSQTKVGTASVFLSVPCFQLLLDDERHEVDGVHLFDIFGREVETEALLNRENEIQMLHRIPLRNRVGRSRRSERLVWDVENIRGDLLYLREHGLVHGRSPSGVRILLQ